MIVHMFVIIQRWVQEYIAHKLLVKEAQKEWHHNGCKGEKPTMFTHKQFRLILARSLLGLPIVDQQYINIHGP